MANLASRTSLRVADDTLGSNSAFDRFRRTGSRPRTFRSFRRLAVARVRAPTPLPAECTALRYA